MKKIQIGVVDFIEHWEKFPIGAQDFNHKEIAYGHTVSYQGEKYLVAYRYGEPVLKPFNSVFFMGKLKWEECQVLNEVTGSQDYLIVGYENEPFIQKLITEGVTA